MSKCVKCGRALTGDETAIYRRIVNRGAAESEILCKTCLAAYFHCSEKRIDEKIKHFRAMGCTLFSPEEK